MALALDRRDCVEIPNPPKWPVVGNLFDLLGGEPMPVINAFSKKYGEIFKLTFFGRSVMFVGSQRLVNELCDEKRFQKSIPPAMMELRHVVNDGLFTAHNDEENWGIGHRTLVPAFGPLNIAGMFDSMKDIASQLVLKWARYGTSYKIPVADDFTRLTLDTLALCAMDYRFNSFYTQETHPFVHAMIHCLKYSEIRARLPQVVRDYVYRKEEAKWNESIAYMRKLSGDVVRERVQNPRESKDLLNAMVVGKDPKTGRGLSDDSIIDNMITFLIAGHETTSGMLSFVMYYLLKNREAYRKVQQEVDEVVGSESVQYEHINKLPYITAVLREASRLMPTAPGFALKPRNPQGEILAGKYFIAGDSNVIVTLQNSHRDPSVYGDDAEEFRPERMLDEQFNALPPNSWKPFGNGQRGCIGRAFAWQEMLIVMTTLFQNFEFDFVDPTYTLELSYNLSIKPHNFFMKATPRAGVTISPSSLGGATQTAKKSKPNGTASPPNGVVRDGKPMTILYGSNSGTCEVFARTLAADAADHGFNASRVITLDEAKDNLPADEPIVIVTASYEGEPTDNAAHFFTWLEGLKDDERIKTNFAVFGCGHSDWKQTFHRVPTTLDKMLERHGGQRLCEIGLANAANGDMMSDFQTWEDSLLWPAMKEKFGGQSASQDGASVGQSVSVDILSKRASILRSDVVEAKVIAVRTLTAEGEPLKKHIDIRLPSDTTYRAGDYCAVLPINPPETVHRVMTRFSLPFDAMLKISSRTGTTLPTDHPVSAHHLFGAYLELSTPATRRNISMLIDAAKDASTKKALSALASGDFNATITEKRVSLLDLLERFPTISLPLSAFVASLIPMRVRQYSISSSPLAHPHQVSLTYALLDEPSTGGGPATRHFGVATNYLSTLRAGDLIHATVKPSHQPFHLPAEPETTPIIMIAAGAGLAPFRGFVQERAAQIATGRHLAPAHLFFGCRGPARDDLYRAELDKWEQMGAVVTHRAYSQTTAVSSKMSSKIAAKVNGHGPAAAPPRRVDDALRAERKLLVDLWEQGAKIYVCGSRGVGESVKKAFLDVAKGVPGREGDGAEAMEAWFEGIRNERYTTDVFT